LCTEPFKITYLLTYLHELPSEPSSFDTDKVNTFMSPLLLFAQLTSLWQSYVYYYSVVAFRYQKYNCALQRPFYRSEALVVGAARPLGPGLYIEKTISVITGW